MKNKTPRDEKGRILPGNSLNPKGKPKGSLTKAGKFREELTQELPDIIQTLIMLAKSGDVSACRIILDRILPPLRAESATIELPTLINNKRLEGKAKAIMDSVAQGEISPDVATGLISALGGLAKIKEIDELERRIIK